MKFINKVWFLALAVIVYAACDKVDDLPLYNTGTAPVLTPSVNAVVPTPADSNNSVLTLNWTDPAYATDSNNQKFILEVDSSGRNFSKAVSREVLGDLSYTFIAKELNLIMLNWGFEYNKAYDLDFRVTSSYANNNERLVTNVVKVNVKTYLVPPKVVPPTTGKLFIVGDATEGGWTNPVPVPKQELTKIDSVTYGGIFEMIGGKKYLILAENGNWDDKFNVADNSLAGLSEGGDFGFKLKDDFPGPATSGLYMIILNFQAGRFTVTPFTQQHGLPEDLFIVGDATAGEWNNPVPVPSQQFNRINSTRWELPSIMLTGGKKYLFLRENGIWDKFGAADGGAPGIKDGGIFKPEGQDIPAPDVTGNYKISFDLINNTFKVTKL